MKKKRKAFTLIELLAVIIVLAIIALIAMPIIFNVIENAKVKSLENSAYGVVDAVRLQYMENLMNSENGAVTLNGNVTDLTLSGEHPTGGRWEIVNDATAEDGRGIKITGVTFASMQGYVCNSEELNNELTGKVICSKGNITEETTKFATLAVDADGDGVAELGDEVCIQDECFYVLTNDGTNIRMLAKYRIDASDNTTRKDRLQRTGTLTTAFASYDVNGTNLNSYEGSIVEDLVGDYKTTLEEDLGAIISEATLLSYDEVTSAPFNCITSSDKRCNSAYSWLYKDGNTTAANHWTRSAKSGSSYSVWHVYDGGYVEQNSYSVSYGVRPVITISSFSILDEEIVITPILVNDADNDGVAELGDEVCIWDECFYVLTNDGTNTRMLAKYRIDVSDNTTRKDRLQNMGTLKTKFATPEVMGTTAHSYEGSIVEDLVGDYKATLEGFGVTINGATLLTESDVKGSPFNCTTTSGSCNPNYSWLYKDGNTTAAAHWTRTPEPTPNPNVLVTENSGHIYFYSYSNEFGVRPVITILSSSIK